MLDDRYFAFLGAGNQPVESALHVLPDATIDEVGTLGAGYAANMATLDAFYAGSENPSYLAPLLGQSW